MLRHHRPHLTRHHVPHLDLLSPKAIFWDIALASILILLIVALSLTNVGQKASAFTSLFNHLTTQNNTSTRGTNVTEFKTTAKLLAASGLPEAYDTLLQTLRQGE